jgi:hypothetical protein
LPLTIPELSTRTVTSIDDTHCVSAMFSNPSVFQCDNSKTFSCPPIPEREV